MGIVTTLVVLLAVFGAAVDSDSSEQCEHGEVLYEARNQWRGESFCAIDSTHEDTCKYENSFVRFCATDSTHEDTCKYENSFVSFCATDSTHEDTSKVENKNNFVVWINQSHSGTVNSAGFKFNLIINEIDVIICITMATQAKLPPLYIRLVEAIEFIKLSYSCGVQPQLCRLNSKRQQLFCRYQMMGRAG